MDSREDEIYEELNKIDKLDAKLYSELLNKYDEETVNKVIEEMIDSDVNNSSKFDYYVTKISYIGDEMVKDGFAAYIVDLSDIPEISTEDNIKLATEIYYIVQELNSILDEFGFNDKSMFWLSDRVEECISKCNDSVRLKEIKKLYNKFLYKRDKMVEYNLRLVIYVSKRYYKKVADINEIVQLGNIGLMKACERYDPTFNTCFSTYAYHWIRQNITREIAHITCPISIPVGLYAFNLSVKKSVNFLRKELKREPRIEEIADHMGESDLEKIKLSMQTFADPISLNEPINGSSDDEEIVVLDSVEDETANIFEQVIKRDLSTEVMELLKNTLTEREFIVLCHRYGLGDCSQQKLQQLGDKYGLSRERIRQIETKAIQKIKRKGKYLIEYLK